MQLRKIDGKKIFLYLLYVRSMYILYIFNFQFLTDT